MRAEKKKQLKNRVLDLFDAKKTLIGTLFLAMIHGVSKKFQKRMGGVET